MRSEDVQNTAMWSYLSPEARVPADHPLRSLRELVNVALRKLSPEFTKMYSPNGRPSIPPERLLRALLLQIFYTVRSERMLMEQLNYNMLFRWFVGLNLDDPVWDVTVFTKKAPALPRGWRRQEVLCCSLGSSARRQSFERRAFHRRRYFRRSLGESQELQAQG